MVEMPALSPTMEMGTLVSWTVEVGDEVEAGDQVGARARVRVRARARAWARARARVGRSR